MDITDILVSIFAKIWLIFAYICWANSLVGVIIKPRRADGIFYSALFEWKSKISDKIGRAKARVLPEPVWDAMRKS